MITTSLFNSKYLSSDNIWRSTVYNSNFIFNALGGYEFQLPKQQTLAINMNIVYAGGLRNIPIDLEESKLKVTQFTITIMLIKIKTPIFSRQTLNLFIV